MRRTKVNRNREISKRLKKLKEGEYQVDIAREFNISPSTITKIKKQNAQRNS